MGEIHTDPNKTVSTGIKNYLLILGNIYKKYCLKSLLSHHKKKKFFSLNFFGFPIFK